MKTRNQEQGRERTKIVTPKDFGIIRLGTCIGSFGKKYMGLESPWGRPYMGVHDPELAPQIVSTRYEPVISIPWDEKDIHPIMRTLLSDKISDKELIELLKSRTTAGDGSYYTEILPRVLHSQLNKKYRDGQLDKRVNSFITHHEFPKKFGDKENIYQWVDKNDRMLGDEELVHAREFAIYPVTLCHLSKRDWGIAVDFLRENDSNQLGGRK